MNSNKKSIHDGCVVAFTKEAASENEAVEKRKKEAAEPIYLSRF